MGEAPTFGELFMLTAAIIVFVAGGVASLLRGRLGQRQLAESGAHANELDRQIHKLRIGAKASLYSGILLTIGVLCWHCAIRGRQPLEDNFGAFLCLGILLALFVAYTQRAHPLRGLDLFIMPVVLMLLVAAAVFGEAKPRDYRMTTWLIVHLVSVFGGFLAFAVAGAVGGMYLLANRRLRQKKRMPTQGFGSLERLEHLTMISATLGFALLTVGLITGFFRVFHPGASGAWAQDWYRNPKVLMACAAWVVYALVLHSPINPSFRGKRTAMLSVLGFGLMIGIIVVVQFMKQ